MVHLTLSVLGFSFMFAMLGLVEVRPSYSMGLFPVSVLDFRAGYASNLFTSVDGPVDVPRVHYARCKACDKQLDRTQDSRQGEALLTLRLWTLF